MEILAAHQTGKHSPSPHPHLKFNPHTTFWVGFYLLHHIWNQHQGKEMPPILKFFHLKTKSTTSSNGLMWRHCLSIRNVQKLTTGFRKFRVITSISQVRKLRLLPQLKSIKSEPWTHNHLFQPQFPHFSNWQPHPVRCLVQKCQDQKNKIK